MRLVFSIAFGFVALCGAASAVRIPEEDLRSMPLNYSDISRYLESRTLAPVYSIRFQRDSIGSKLFISFYFRKDNGAAHRTLMVTGGGIREIVASPKVWYDDKENPVYRLEGGKEWYVGEGADQRFLKQFEEANYVFKTGAVVPFKAIWAEIRGVSGGNFVLLKFREKPG